jgi:hypothetical protein
MRALIDLSARKPLSHCWSTGVLLPGSCSTPRLLLLGYREMPVVNSKCQRGKVIPVHVVSQVENIWKPRPGRQRFIPDAIGILMIEQPSHSSGNRLGGCAPRSYQSQESPSSLTWSAFGSNEPTLPIPVAAFSPSTVRILHRYEPLLSPVNFLACYSTSRRLKAANC